MQLKDLYKPLEELTEDELKARLQEIRNNRTVVRPAKQARAKKEASKGRTTAFNKLHAMLAAMPEAEREQFLLQLGEPE